MAEVNTQVASTQNSKALKIMNGFYKTGQVIKEIAVTASPMIGRGIKHRAIDFSNDLVVEVHKAENASSCKEAFQIMSKWGKKTSSGALGKTIFGTPAAIMTFYYAAPFLFAAAPILSHILAVVGGASMGMGVGQGAQSLYDLLKGNKISSSIKAESENVLEEETKIQNAVLAAQKGQSTDELRKILNSENLEQIAARRMQLDMMQNKYDGIKEGIKFGGSKGGALAGGMVAGDGLIEGVWSALHGGKIIPNNGCLSQCGLSLLGGKAGAIAGTLAFEALAGLAGIAIYLVSKIMDGKSIESVEEELKQLATPGSDIHNALGQLTIDNTANALVQTAEPKNVNENVVTKKEPVFLERLLLIPETV